MPGTIGAVIPAANARSRKRRNTVPSKKYCVIARVAPASSLRFRLSRSCSANPSAVAASRRNAPQEGVVSFRRSRFDHVVDRPGFVRMQFIHDRQMNIQAVERLAFCAQRFELRAGPQDVNVVCQDLDADLLHQLFRFPGHLLRVKEDDPRLVARRGNTENVGAAFLVRCETEQSDTAGHC